MINSRLRTSAWKTLIYGGTVMRYASPLLETTRMPALTDEHKEALAKGRRQAVVVKKYLAALETGRKRGPKMTPTKLQDRIAETAVAIQNETDPATKVELIQQRLDDQHRLNRLSDQDSHDGLQADFVDVVADYSNRKTLSYAAWRELGVPAAVLRRGGLTRGN